MKLYFKKLGMIIIYVAFIILLFFCMGFIGITVENTLIKNLFYFTAPTILILIISFLKRFNTFKLKHSYFEAIKDKNPGLRTDVLYILKSKDFKTEIFAFYTLLTPLFIYLISISKDLNIVILIICALITCTLCVLIFALIDFCLWIFVCRTWRKNHSDITGQPLHSKRVNKKLIIVAIAVVVVFCISSALILILNQMKPSKYADLGIPLHNRYSADNAARNIWDMTVFDGKLYVGSGDYDKNEGPVEAWRYDIASKKWSNSGVLPDEQINRFVVIGGKLIIPGTDPKADWSLGNYYELQNDKWATIRTIPGGIHNFDMTEYDGKIFAGIGVEPGSYPIACSDDNGKTFKQVEMWKDGKKISTYTSEFVRSYELFVLNNKLYADYSFMSTVDRKPVFDIYRYDNGKFVYDTGWYEKIGDQHKWYTAIGSKIAFKNRLFFTTGSLYVTDNVTDVSKVPLQADTVWDLMSENNTLYALCSRKLSNGTYRIFVMKNETGASSDFKELLYFDYPIPARSFTYSDNVFYFGMGALDSKSPKMGTVLSVKIEK